MVENCWEPLDWRNGHNEAHDFFGVFATYGDSPSPYVIFDTKEEAESWVKATLENDGQSPSSDLYCVSLCREGHDGRLWVWNSFQDTPAGLAGGES